MSINFRDIIDELHEGNWDGVIALEYLAERTVGVRNNAVVQNVLLACQLEELIGAG